MPDYRKSTALSSEVATENDRWQVEHGHLESGGQVLEIRLASAGVVAGIAEVRAYGKGMQFSPFDRGELSRLPSRLVVKQATRWTQHTISF